MRGVRAFLLAMAGGILLGLACGQARAAAEVGQPAPPLATTELDGQTFDLGGLRGKVVIVNFWATWCVPCRAEMPALDAFYRRYHDQGLDMIGISADRPRDRSGVVSMMKAFAYPAAMLRDAKVNGFGAPEAIPITYVVDRSGIVRVMFRADQTEVTQQSLDAAVLPLLSAKPTG